jgi:hypothetical protein
MLVCWRGYFCRPGLLWRFAERRIFNFIATNFLAAEIQLKLYGDCCPPSLRERPKADAAPQNSSPESGRRRPDEVSSSFKCIERARDRTRGLLDVRIAQMCCSTFDLPACRSGAAIAATWSCLWKFNEGRTAGRRRPSVKITMAYSQAPQFARNPRLPASCKLISRKVQNILI